MTDNREEKKKRRILSWTFRGLVFALLTLLFWSCGSVPGLQEEVMETYIKVPFVRVLLQDQSEKIEISGDGSFAIECLKNDVQTVFYSSQPIRIENGYENLRVLNRSGDWIAEELTEVNIIPRGRGNRIKVGDRKYRGIMKIVPHGLNIRLINIIHMEDYLKGVVPPEIGPRAANEFAAIEAQAVAARTYAMAHLQQYTNEPFDVKSSIIDQVYEGVNSEKTEVNRAIDATAGKVMMYQDKMIDAYYHSTCGGMTDDIVDVWDKGEVPYLKPVVDSACRWSKYFNWEESFTGDQFKARIEKYLSQERGKEVRISPITDVLIISRTAGGRINKLEIKTETNSYNFYKDRIRWVIGRASTSDLILPSANFTAKVQHDNQGRATRITLTGSGYGHGVGMCQCGAIGLAREGWTYENILKHFYSGVEIKELY
jgi:stage II sporulation protein D